MYPLMQVYGSLAFEHNSEIGEAVLVRCSISCLVPSSLQPKKQTHALQLVNLGEDLVIFLTYEVGVAGSIPRRINWERAWNGPGIPLHCFSVQT